MDDMAVEVRPFTNDDRAGVTALWIEAFPDDPPRNRPDRMIARKMTVQPELFLVALMDGRVIGTVLAGFDGVRGWIYHLAVEEASRRRGVGTRLVRAAEQALAALGCPKINLQVRSSNAAVVGFYTALGYVVEERVSLGKPLGEEEDDRVLYR